MTSQLVVFTEDLAVARELYRGCGPGIRHAAHAAAAHFDVDVVRLFIRRRIKTVFRRRAVLIAAVRSTTRLSLSDIGARLGGYDHTSILNADRVARSRYSSNLESVLAILRARVDQRVVTRDVATFVGRVQVSLPRVSCLEARS